LELVRTTNKIVKVVNLEIVILRELQRAQGAASLLDGSAGGSANRGDETTGGVALTESI